MEHDHKTSVFCKLLYMDLPVKSCRIRLLPNLRIYRICYSAVFQHTVVIENCPVVKIFSLAYRLPLQYVIDLWKW